MRLSAFRIRNFRSILDSGWNSISPDNITVLIGQNESGKTSVLEALNCFYTGVITDEILRSDLSLPCVYCDFYAEPSDIALITQTLNLPENIKECLKNKDKILLKRSWNANKVTTLEIGNEDIVTFYNQERQNREKAENLLLSKIYTTLDKGNTTEKSILTLKQEEDQLSREYAKLQSSLVDFQKQIQRAKTPESKIQFQTEHDKTHLSSEQVKKRIDNIQSRLYEHQKELGDIFELYKHCKNTVDSIHKAYECEKKLKSLSEALFLAEESLQEISNPRDLKAVEQKIESLKHQEYTEKLQYDNNLKESSINKAIAAGLIEGLSFEDARQDALKKLSGSHAYASLEQIGEAFYSFLPAFEFFEDFSSLLPNRIDLEDLLNENTYVEGYKAAKNFLIISGIDAHFFEQQNNRILKQKIENLNGELTINFQDFWRQSIGKNNKIKIQFELEHYDFNHPDKKGKPYLEFWIKDTKERLYPKQRSRGVRWFLSFYLELRAAAKLHHKERILLIDEPGISLHARAQEDVLKVFEDIKENLMIIYTTHSPHLVDVNKIYRVLAIQRALEDEETSETLVFDATSLNKASSDTLSPIYALMGARFSDQQFIRQNNNILVEDNAAFYYLSALYHLVKPNKEMYFLPATSAQNVHTLANLLLGWKLEFAILLCNSHEVLPVKKEIEEKLYGNDPNRYSNKIIFLENQRGIADLFSTIDFKNHILNKRVGITEMNSEYVENNNLSNSLLSMEFKNNVNSGKIRFEDFDDETKENITRLFRKLEELLN